MGFILKTETLIGQATVPVGTTVTLVTLPLKTAAVPLTAGRYCHITVRWRLISRTPNAEGRLVVFDGIIKGGATPTINNGGGMSYGTGSGNADPDYAIDGNGDLAVKAIAGSGTGCGDIDAFVEVEAAIYGLS